MEALVKAIGLNPICVVRERQRHSEEEFQHRGKHLGKRKLERTFPAKPNSISSQQCSNLTLHQNHLWRLSNLPHPKLKWRTDGVKLQYFLSSSPGGYDASPGL
jgi:hypothetical protein